jgi:nucleotide-binding universal stress UspA family protein
MHFLFGSKGESVAKRAPISVLLVRTPVEKEKRS